MRVYAVRIGRARRFSFFPSFSFFFFFFFFVSFPLFLLFTINRLAVRFFLESAWEAQFLSFLSSSSSSSRRGKWNCPRTLHSEFTFTRNSRYGIPGKTAIESWSRSRFLPPFIHFWGSSIPWERINTDFRKMQNFDRSTEYFYICRVWKFLL